MEPTAIPIIALKFLGLTGVAPAATRVEVGYVDGNAVIVELEPLLPASLINRVSMIHGWILCLLVLLAEYG